MIHSLTVINHLNESLKIVMGDPDSSGFLIANIEGIGPPTASINSTDMASGDGTVFNSARLESRNIVISMFYGYYPSVEENRHRAYRFFPIKRKVTLIFETDTRICTTEGYVETNETSLFTSAEGCQISIICPDPYFYSLEDGGVTVTKFGSIYDKFEFPFSNDSLTEPLIEFGVMEIKDVNNVYYLGDADVGVEIEISVIDDVGDITIVNVRTGETMKLSANKIRKITEHEPKSKDLIKISTTRNNKYAILTRGAKTFNILNALDKNSNWFKLMKGDNYFSYHLDKGRVIFTIRNQTLYEGL